MKKEIAEFILNDSKIIKNLEEVERNLVETLNDLYVKNIYRMMNDMNTEVVIDANNKCDYCEYPSITYGAEKFVDISRIFFNDKKEVKIETEDEDDFGEVDIKSLNHEDICIIYCLVKEFWDKYNLNK